MLPSNLWYSPCLRKKPHSRVSTSPEFVINERTMGIMGKDSNGNRKYYEKATFSITLLKHVDAGGQDSGFLCLVKCSITGQDRYHNVIFKYQYPYHVLWMLSLQAWGVVAFFRHVAWVYRCLHHHELSLINEV